MDSFARSLPPLSRLRPFEAAARLESFTLAAAELGLTQTAVSKQISLLEADLGTALFERRNRAVFLTEEGRRFGRVVTAALAEIAAEAAHLRGALVPGGLVLHCQLCEAFYWLMPRLSRFHERHPDIELRVVSSLEPLTAAREPFDVAIQTTGRASGSARLAFTAADEVFPVCAPEVLKGVSLPLAPQELSAFPLLSHLVVPQDWMDWSDWFDVIGVPVPADLRPTHFDSFPLVVQAAVAGQGIALGWRRTVDTMLAEGKLVRPSTDVVKRPTELSVFRGSRRGGHAETRALLDWLGEELALPL
ncbi:DNA-binding transcriptional LysR family regulator [Rhodobium orientis]|uniref:LysR family transcriptional regulator n=1 Tax=Rhodobium orientis TaxID=34017 RepID=A0A327JI26_9HYPH|nr:LysR substrate-binding domain-containing protein [Rhodobium orientis]MBB4302913.1 DNA-binding transcriptional LysR family regulator [Rhodobium orientis]MBK5949474.1 LysR family transcriptional regulator [Rhodobium orientis]RAI26040.1 LysR family transcriptional regulator [Rhodobium orientis]